MKESLWVKQGTVGLITYMRTDSTRIADTAKAEAAALIEDTYGKEFSDMITERSKCSRRTRCP